MNVYKAKKFMMFAMVSMLHCTFCIADDPFGVEEKFFVIPAILPSHMTNGMSVLIDGSEGLEKAVRGVLKEISVDYRHDDILQEVQTNDFREIYIMGSDSYASALWTLRFPATKPIPINDLFEQIARLYGMHLLTNERTFSFCNKGTYNEDILYVITGKIGYSDSDKRVKDLNVKPKSGVALLYVMLMEGQYICVVKCERRASRIRYGNHFLKLNEAEHPWAKLVFVFDNAVEVELPYTNLDHNEVNVWNIEIGESDRTNVQQ